MVWIIITICLFTSFVDLAMQKKLTLLSLFCLMWAGFSFFPSLHLFGLIDFSTRIYFLAFLGITGFILGYLVMYLLNRRPNPNLIMHMRLGLQTDLKTDFLTSKYRINYRLFNIFGVIVAIFYLQLAYKFFRLMLQGVSWTEIRYSYYVFGQSFTKGESVLSTWFMEPLAIFVFITVASVAFYENKATKFMIFISLLCFGLHFFCTQSGTDILYLLCIEMFLFFDYKVISKKHRKLFIWIALLSALLVMLVVNDRLSGNSDLTLGRRLYSLFAQPFVLFSHCVSTIDEMNMRTWGLSFIYGFVNIFFDALGIIGIHTSNFFTKTGEILNDLVSTGIVSFASQQANTNAVTTAFTFFYLDFGSIGIFVESFILGGVSSTVYLYHLKEDNSYARAFYALFSILVFFTRTFWFLYYTTYILSFVFLRLCFKKKNQVLGCQERRSIS